MKKKKVKAGGGIVFLQNEEDAQNPFVLLIFRNQVWDLPKGKKEKGESMAMCASREVAEETSSNLPMIIRRLTDTYHEYSFGKKHYAKTTAWYAMCHASEQAFRPQEEEGIEKVEWVSLAQATEQVGYDNLRVVLNDFTKWYKSL